MRTPLKYIYYLMILLMIFSMERGWALSAQEVYEKVGSSVFTIYGVEKGDSKKTVLGSAIAISKNLLATNCHVALAGNYLVAEVDYKLKVGRLIYHDVDKDICLIEIVDANFLSVPIRHSSDVKIGEEVFAIGNPGGLKKTLSRGIISNKSILDKKLFLQTDAAISSGSSGGGLFDNQGNLVGITTFGFIDAENIGFAIPAEVISVIIGENNVKKNIELAKENPTSAQDASVTARLNNHQTQIYYYGVDKIGLIKKDLSCEIYIQGKDKSGTITSSILWNPEWPRSFSIFPFFVSFDDVVEGLKKLDIDLRKTNLKDSKSYLVLDNVLYETTIDSALKNPYLMHVAVVDKNPTQIMLSGLFLLAQFKDVHNEEGYFTVWFGLRGFSHALAAYRSFCQ